MAASSCWSFTKGSAATGSWRMSRSPTTSSTGGSWKPSPAYTTSTPAARCRRWPPGSCRTPLRVALLDGRDVLGGQLQLARGDERIELVGAAEADDGAVDGG